MKKVINITIGSIVFPIEEDAYESLDKYLESIKSHFKKNKNRDEIVEDIETSISEKFFKRKGPKNAAITIRDVSRVVKEMGTVKDFKGAEPETEEEGEWSEKDVSKKLYRSTDDVVIAGVAAGLAAYFDIETTLVRLLFFLSLFIGGFGLILYVVLWIIVPEAETTAQKFEMRGERVTLKEIEKSVKKGVDTLKKKDLKKGAKNAEAFLAQFFKLLGQAARPLLELIRYVIGFSLVFAGLTGIFALTFSITWLLTGTAIPETSYTVQDFFILTDSLYWSFLLSIYLVGTLPLLGIFFIGWAIVKKKAVMSSGTIIVLFVLWFIALGLTGSVVTDNLENIEVRVKEIENKVDRGENVRFESDVLRFEYERDGRPYNNPSVEVFVDVD